MPPEQKQPGSVRARWQSVMLGAVIIALIIFSTTGLILVLQPQRTPSVQGVLIQPRQNVSDFQLTDHKQQAFTNDHLQGRWHLVSYGFTHCPQFCASTLSSMTALTRLLAEEQSPYDDLGLLFYTVDAERDTPKELARYVPHFHPDLVGLTHTGATDERYQPFERSLGILYEQVPDDQDGGYTVNHGVKLLLLNPQGQLHAVFEPSFHPSYGLHYFSLERLHADYLAVRSAYH
ncbi:MAG: SCO family protein [Natronospirillum sp.]